MDPTNKTMVVEIGGREVTLYFNANMQMRFEELTGQFFMDWFVDLMTHAQRFFIESVKDRAMEVDAESSGESDEKITAKKLVEKLEQKIDENKLLNLLKLISTKKFLALIAAAAHEYDDHGEPQWLLSTGDLGKTLDHSDIATLFSPIFLRLMHNFTPGKTSKPAKPVDDDKPAEPPRPTGPTPAKTRSGGGKSFGPSEDVVLGSLRKKSAG